MGKVNLQQKGKPVSIDYDQTLNNLRDPEKRQDPSFNVAVLNFNKQYDPYPENGVQVFDKQGKQIKTFKNMSDFSSEMLTEQPKGSPTSAPAVDTFSNFNPALTPISTTTGQGNSTPTAAKEFHTFTGLNPPKPDAQQAMAQSTATPPAPQPTPETSAIPTVAAQTVGTPTAPTSESTATTASTLPATSTAAPNTQAAPPAGDPIQDTLGAIGQKLYDTFVVEVPKKYGEWFSDPTKLGKDVQDHIWNTPIEEKIPLPNGDFSTPDSSADNILNGVGMAGMLFGLSPLKFGKLGKGMTAAESSASTTGNLASRFEVPSGTGQSLEQVAKNSDGGVGTGASSGVGEGLKKLPQGASEVLGSFQQKFVQYAHDAKNKVTPGPKPENVIAAKESGGTGGGVAPEQVNQVLPSFQQKLLNHAANADKAPENAIAPKDEIAPAIGTSPNKNTLPPKAPEKAIEPNGQTKPTTSANLQPNMGAQSVGDAPQAPGFSGSGNAPLSSSDFATNGKLEGGGYEVPQGNGQSLLMPEKPPGNGNGGVGNEIPNAPTNPVVVKTQKYLEATKSSTNPAVIRASDELKQVADNYLKNPTRENEQLLSQAYEKSTRPPVKPVQQPTTVPSNVKLGPPTPPHLQTTKTKVAPSNTPLGPPTPPHLQTTKANAAPSNVGLGPPTPPHLQTKNNVAPSSPTPTTTVNNPMVAPNKVTSEVSSTPQGIAQTPPTKLTGKAEIELYEQGLTQAQDALKSVGQKYTGPNGFQVQQSALNLHKALKTYAEKPTLENQKAVLAAQSNLSRLTSNKIQLPKGPSSLPILPGSLSVKQISQIVGGATGAAVGVSVGQSIAKGQSSASAGAGGNPTVQTSLAVPSSNAQTSKTDGVINLPPYVDVHNDGGAGDKGSGAGNTSQNAQTGSASNSGGASNGSDSSTEGTSQSSGSSSSSSSGGGGSGGGSPSGGASAAETAGASSAGMAPMGAAGAGAATAAGMSINELLALFLELSQKVYQGTATPEDFLTLQSIIPQLEEAGMLQDSPQILQLKQMVAENVPPPADAAQAEAPPAEAAAAEAAPAEAA